MVVKVWILFQACKKSEGFFENFVFSLDVEDCYHGEQLSLNSYRILH